MTPRRGGLTAQEVLARLDADPAYQAMRKTRDNERIRLAEQRRREQQPLLNDLAAAGVSVDWIGRLCGIPVPDERIYPVLLDHLTRSYAPWLLEWIGRAFGRKSARPIIWDTLVKLLKTHALEEPAAEGVMAAISEMARPDDLSVLIDLISDRSLGSGRLYLVGNLMRSKRPQARATLVRLQDDPVLTQEIRARLARSRA